MVERVAQSVDVLGLHGNSVDVVNWTGAGDIVDHSAGRSTFEDRPRPPYTNMDVLGDLTVLGVDPPEDVLRGPDEVPYPLHLRESVSKCAIPSGNSPVQRNLANLPLPGSEAGNHLRCDVRPTVIGGHRGHRATSALSSLLSARMWLITAPRRSLAALSNRA